ncbi:ATP-dependent helicase [Parathermosynechococcus lividus]|uniref:ATP-dependent helicase n=1 Tax=Parathermosynechococcus lividus TaxID=33070 RepID=UPI001D0D141B|nr:ATP-dependent helicase [Thermostichus lividus]
MNTVESLVDDWSGQLRPGQREIAQWRGGLLAVSAVPGAGKSHGMAVGAAIAIARQRLNQQQQLVVVTYSRSAAASIKVRIRHYLNQMGLPRTGFSVQTLHSLALKIAMGAPNWRGSAENLLSEYEQQRLCRRCVDQWARSHPDQMQHLIQGMDTQPPIHSEQLTRRHALISSILTSFTKTVVTSARSAFLTPAELRQLSHHPAIAADPYPFLEIAADLLELYQHQLYEREQIDYDEMILAAVQCLDANASYRQEWQQRVYAVFEDEAQDSTPLQSRLLRLLATDVMDDRIVNVVRVGDPNQAINSTFTAADPLFFNAFCDECAQQNAFYTMTQAGRCTPLVIKAANYLVEWANHTYAQTEPPFRPQDIQPVPPGDPQPDANPPAWGQGVELVYPKTIFETAHELAVRIARVFEAHPKATVAILVRQNKQGHFLADLLRSPADFGLNHNLPSLGITIFDVAGVERRSHVPEELFHILQFLYCPYSPDRVKNALTVLVERGVVPPQNLDRLAAQPEVFLYPGPLDPPATAEAVQAQHFCHGLLQARLQLSLFPLIAYCAQRLGYDAAELATTDRLIYYLSQSQEPQLWERLAPIWQGIVAENTFEPVDMEDLHSRYVRPAQVTILTMHKAKGLDWDAVFVPFLQAKNLPGDLWVPANARFLGEVDFIAVTRAQIRAHSHGQPIPNYQEAWRNAAAAKTAEEYRLLYVAITRAKRLLWLAAAQQAPFWPSFDWHHHYELQPQAPCPFLPALQQQLAKWLSPIRGDR